MDSYLDNYSVETAEENGVENANSETIRNDINELKEELANLSEEEQEKLAYYFSDPEAMQAAIEDDANEDVIIESEDVFESTKPLLKAGVTKTRNATHSYSMKFFGITMTKYVVSVKYTTSGGTVKSIVSSSGYVDKNYNPTVKTSRIEKNAWIANNRAKTTSRFKYSLVHKEYGVELGTITVHVEGTSGGGKYNGYAKIS
ncbi:MULTISPECIES: hypothetical protein [Listeria]|uniref:hypothetical protein n=1 Tax=Listeria TaxID=1637 RepID=UPI000B596097|nr:MULTISPECIES: hypothetical protein [Listeria]